MYSVLKLQFSSGDNEETKSLFRRTDFTLWEVGILRKEWVERREGQDIQ